MNNTTLVLALVLTACSGWSDPESLEPNTVTVTVTETEIITVEVPVESTGTSTETNDTTSSNLILFFDNSELRLPSPIAATANMGEINLLPSVNGAFVMVRQLNLRVYISTDPYNGIYNAGSSNGFYANDYLEQCVLFDNKAGNVFMGPLDPDVDGNLNFTDDFWLESVMNLQIRCYLRDSVDPGTELGLAVNWNSGVSAQDNVDLVDDNDNPVLVDMRGQNGDSFNPDFAVVLAFP